MKIKHIPPSLNKLSICSRLINQKSFFLVKSNIETWIRLKLQLVQNLISLICHRRLQEFFVCLCFANGGTARNVLNAFNKSDLLANNYLRLLKINDLLPAVSVYISRFQYESSSDTRVKYNALVVFTKVKDLRVWKF